MLAIIILMSPVLSTLPTLAPDEGETGNTFFETIPAEFSKTYFESIANDSAGFFLT